MFFFTADPRTLSNGNAENLQVIKMKHTSQKIYATYKIMPIFLYRKFGLVLVHPQKPEEKEFPGTADTETLASTFNPLYKSL